MDEDKGNKLTNLIASVLVLALAIVLFGFPVQWLWNNGVAAIFGLSSVITFWDAVKLHLLAAILIGSPTVLVTACKK